jgi:hypothetical protein
MGVFGDYLATVEDVLCAVSPQANALGHRTNIGTAREVFIRNVLLPCLPPNLAVSSGEVIDMNAQSGQPRTQVDTIVYRTSYPHIPFDTRLHAVFSEAALACIEVKSILTEAEVLSAAKNANEVSKLVRGRYSGGMLMNGVNNEILRFLVAYTGPAQMQTVGRWLHNAHHALALPIVGTEGQHAGYPPCPSLHAIVVLGLGVVFFRTPVFKPNNGQGSLYDLQDTQHMHFFAIQEKGIGLPLMVMLMFMANQAEQAGSRDLSGYFQGIQPQAPDSFGAIA